MARERDPKDYDGSIPLSNERQEYFCNLYCSKDEMFANGLQSYAEAYNCDLDTKQGYATARSNASRLLTDADVLKRINYLLGDMGLNDEFVDKQLTLVITQNNDLHSKVKGIAEYNKLKARIVAKSESKLSGSLSLDVSVKPTAEFLEFFKTKAKQNVDKNYPISDI